MINRTKTETKNIKKNKKNKRRQFSKAIHRHAAHSEDLLSHPA